MDCMSNDSDAEMLPIKDPIVKRGGWSDALVRVLILTETPNHSHHGDW